jgi:transaldolase
MNNFKIKIYSDGADIDEIRETNKYKFVSGFTTNPSLLKRAGVENYLEFAKNVVCEFPNQDFSFEVFSDKPDEMLAEAKILHSLGPNVYVKIPIINTLGESTIPVIKQLSEKNINMNITAITTFEQVKSAEDNFKAGTKNLISIFVGRLSDAGVDPMDFIKASVDETAKHLESQLLWASTREVRNVYEAEQMGVDIITVPPAILKKLNNVGAKALEISLDTVKGFERDIKISGLHVL